MFSHRYDLWALVGTFICLVPLYTSPPRQAVADVSVVEAVDAEASVPSASWQARRSKADTCFGTEASWPEPAERADCPGGMGR